jgi:ABC-type transport system involved in cytochrome c biogenesis permease subunit
VTAAGVVEAGFLGFFVYLVWRLARGSPLADPGAPAAAWGTALLLLALSMPFLLPWYAAWFAPFLWIFADDVVLMAGALATGVLALTLIPADPFHGYSTRGVMDGVHYGAASVLLVVLFVVARRVLRQGPSADGRSVTSTAASEEHEIGTAALR